jgi:hypothetical protein
MNFKKMAMVGVAAWGVGGNAVAQSGITITEGDPNTTSGTLNTESVTVSYEVKPVPKTLTWDFNGDDVDFTDKDDVTDPQSLGTLTVVDPSEASTYTIHITSNSNGVLQNGATALRNQDNDADITAVLTVASSSTISGVEVVLGGSGYTVSNGSLTGTVDYLVALSGVPGDTTANPTTGVYDTTFVFTVTATFE